jgi:hypothetical protein
VIEAKAFQSLGHGPAAEVWAATDDNPGRLATGMRIHDMDTFDGVEHIRGGVFNTWFAKAHEQAIWPACI